MLYLKQQPFLCINACKLLLGFYFLFNYLCAQVFRERAIQLKFNEDKRKRKIEKDLEAARKQRLEAEQYRKDMMDERQKNEELKRARAEKLLKE